jgi:hypothetical protein
MAGNITFGVYPMQSEALHGGRPATVALDDTSQDRKFSHQPKPTRSKPFVIPVHMQIGTSACLASGMID